MWRKKYLMVFVGCLLVFTIITLVVIFVFYYEGGSVESLKAVIVDNLAINNPNKTFVNEARSVLETAGLEVDYVAADSVTLEVYQRLAEYKVVILRVHSGVLEGARCLCFFTSEKLGNIARYSKWLNHLANASLLGVGNFIGVKPSFIKECVEGEFPGSIVIAMGCKSLAEDAKTMAKAFIDKGARVYIGWSTDVTPFGTDNATLILLKRFFLENKTVREGLEGLIDPNISFPSLARLKCYPETPETWSLRPFMLIKKEAAEYGKSFFLSVFSASLHPCCLKGSYRRLFQKFLNL